MKTRLLCAVTATILGGALLGGCGALDRATGAGTGDGMETVSVDVLDGTSVEGIALAALGVADPSASPSTTAGPGAGKRHPLARHKAKVLLRRNVLHGEVVVQTKEGPKTVVVQRGEVTAKADGTLTVKSSDGYIGTWSVNDQTRVVDKGAKASLDSVTVGAQVAVAGTKTDQTTALLVVIPKKA